jgi:hypothetical protein
VQGTGGPEFVMRQPLQGLPIKQVVNTATPVQISQQGSATADSGYPTPPACVLPGAEHAMRRSITHTLPRYDNGSYVEYGTQWSYQMEVEMPVGTILPAPGR